MLHPVAHWGNAFPRLKIANADFYYKLGEASGTRADSSPNAFDLTAVNTPGQGTGKVGNCATFDNANNRKLTHADSAKLRFDSDGTIVLWVKMSSFIASTNAFVGKWNVGGEYIISYEGPYGGSQNRFRFHLNNGSTGVSVFANTFGAVSTNTWYFVTCQRVGSTMKISVNAGAFDTGTQSGYLGSSFRVFSVGSLDENGYSINGSLDQVIKFPFVLTQAEINHLYNSNNGRELS